MGWQLSGGFFPGIIPYTCLKLVSFNLLCHLEHRDIFETWFTGILEVLSSVCKAWPSWPYFQDFLHPEKG